MLHRATMMIPATSNATLGAAKGIPVDAFDSDVGFGVSAAAIPVASALLEEGRTARIELLGRTKPFLPCLIPPF
jgi:hypothetical protein